MCLQKYSTQAGWCQQIDLDQNAYTMTCLQRELDIYVSYMVCWGEVTFFSFSKIFFYVCFAFQFVSPKLSVSACTSNYMYMYVYMYIWQLKTNDALVRVLSH